MSEMKLSGWELKTNIINVQRELIKHLNYGDSNKKTGIVLCAFRNTTMSSIILALKDVSL
jgi:hypothetical protein